MILLLAKIGIAKAIPKIIIPIPWKNKAIPPFAPPLIKSALRISFVTWLLLYELWNYISVSYIVLDSLEVIGVLILFYHDRLIWLNLLFERL